MRKSDATAATAVEAAAPPAAEPIVVTIVVVMLVVTLMAVEWKIDCGARNKLVNAIQIRLRDFPIHLRRRFDF